MTLRFFARGWQRLFSAVLAALALGEISLLVAIAESHPDPSSSEVFNPLLNTLLTKTRRVLTACEGQGGTALAVGTGQEGVIVCGDSTSATVSFKQYVGTVSDVLASSVLLRTLLGAAIGLTGDSRQASHATAKSKPNLGFNQSNARGRV